MLKSLVILTAVAAFASSATAAEPKSKPGTTKPDAVLADDGLSLRSPRDWQVIQRRTLREGVVPVAGRCGPACDRVEVRLVDKTAWMPTRLNLATKEFTLELPTPAGGWYALEVRAWKGREAVAMLKVEHIGVGEVFVTCGQSNAANHGQPPQKAQDGRVSSCDFQTGRWQHADDPQPGASGTGGSPWPALGDRIARKYDVPVGFICVGVGGTPVSYWIPAQGMNDPLAKNAMDLIAASPSRPYHARFIQDIGKGYPRVRKALELAGAHGVRAVLWHQGESDSALGTPAADYASMLASSIRQSRLEAGWDVPWGVALIGWNPSPDATAARQAAIVAGQKQVIATVPGVFPGPATDSFHERGWLCDPVHFNAQGLTAHAQGWADALSPLIEREKHHETHKRCTATPESPYSENSGGYNVVWDTPSENSVGSMPMSGGELGLNVWVEGDDLLFYIAHPDSRTEDQKLVKLGRVRLSFGAGAFKKNFRQELDLAESCIRISGDGIKLRLWVDAFTPVVHVEMESGAPVEAKVAYESWRFTATPVANGLEWVYRLDPAKIDLAGRLRKQGLAADADKVIDPMTNLTLGGRIVCPGLVADGTGDGVYMKTPFKAWKLRTPQPVRKLDLRVLLRVAQDDSVATWRGELDKLRDAQPDRQKNLAFWKEFWNRSWIDINPDAGEADDGWKVGRNYALFRYLLAANRLGRSPTLFNGGNHTPDNPMDNAKSFALTGPNPDERPWWTCIYMAQNQRLVYWPMLKSGDTDLLQVTLDFYRARAPLQQARAKRLMGCEGTPFEEAIDNFGLIVPKLESADGHNRMAHLRYHYTSAIEFAFMMAEECRFNSSAPAKSLPVMLGVLKFYDSFYQQQCRQNSGKPLGADGKLVIYPGNACEQGVGCKNHSDAVGGLKALAAALLNLDIPAADRAWVAEFANRLPAIPITRKENVRTIALAESWKSIYNRNEFPQLYTIFPFHNYGVGLPDLDLARNTWKAGLPIQKEVFCWKYGNIAVARLGLANEAKSYALQKFLWPAKSSGKSMAYGPIARFVPRFPAFWNTWGFCSVPDMDHGGCAMIGLQEMLMQTPGDRILLLPAWPKEWNVNFKLHAPKQTTVECELRAGKVVKLIVTPESRKKDVEICLPFT